MDFTSLPETYLHDTALLNEALMQLEKDFTQSGISPALNLPDPFSFELLCVELGKAIREISNRNWSELQNLLYRIDISELLITNYTKVYPEKEYDVLLAELLLKRELQKVLLRKQFSQIKNEDHE